MRFIAIFAVLAFLHTSALCQDTQVSSAISELGALITEIPAVIADGGAGVAQDLATLLKILDPQGVVSDLPAIFSSDLPGIESFFAAFFTAAIPIDAVPTDIVADIPAFVTGEGSLILSELGALVTQVPGTLSLSNEALPSFLASMLPELGTDIESIASAVLADLSKSLRSTSIAPANANSSHYHPIHNQCHLYKRLLSTTTSNIAATATGTAPPIEWKAEIARVLGFAAVVALL